MAVLNILKVITFMCLLVIPNIVNADIDSDTEDISRYSDGDILKQVLSKMEAMHAKIKKLEKSESSLKQSISVLIGTTAQFRLQIADLEQSNKEKGERISFLENKLASSSELDRAVNRDTQEAEHAVVNGKVSGKEKEVRTDVDNGATETIRRENDRPTIRESRQVPEQVAFTAYLDHVIRNLGKDQPIVYNMILLNEAGAYSVNSGIFRAPVAGVYLFSWSATARKLPGESPHDIWIKLVVNGVHMVGAVAESRSDGDDNQGSNTVVLRLNQGDEVWTAHYGGTDIYGADNERTTSFTGVLLYMD
ncbi:uncharacterized protein LOC123562575 [Mercenaria mercenaria]|uniref:uncharacterized protein LOC123562575 n=1 Tax=Mercenaria mercenaria TaxID=6596 RepID=UPI00234F4819|nr:uncharacterized protein LOC123562575 [Mercenaria mercenaria]